VTDNETEATNRKNKCRNVERREIFRKRRKTASWEIRRELFQKIGKITGPRFSHKGKIYLWDIQLQMYYTKYSTNWQDNS
jgi:hypothetical protein